MRDISTELQLIMQTYDCDALCALRILCSEEEYNDVISILQPKPTEESRR